MFTEGIIIPPQTYDKCRCYIDGPVDKLDQHILPTTVHIGYRFGNEVLLDCQSQAMNAGATFFGLRSPAECYWGKGSDPATNLIKFGQPTSSADCSIDCNGDGTPNPANSMTKCGGLNRMSVYRMSFPF